MRVSAQFESATRTASFAGTAGSETVVSSYTAYGLSIRSHLPLPELLAGEAEAEVVIRFGKAGPKPPGEVVGGALCWASATQACLSWKEAGTFLIRDGREITIDRVPGAEERLLRLYLLGPVLAVLLHQRGQLVLHSSAVAMNGGAVAFLGGQGLGKSTLAAALHARGYGILVDDVLALEVNQRGYPLVFPGFAQLKLWPETSTALGEPFQELPRLHPRREKRARRISQGFHESTLPLKRIYVLAEGAAHVVEALEPREALIELVRHSYRVRLLQPLTPVSHFLRCASVVNQVAVCRLTFQRSLQVYVVSGNGTHWHPS